MLIVPRESASHWYFPDGTPLHEVPRADGKGHRPTSLRDARKLGLLPSVTNVLSVLAKPGLDSWKQEQAILAALTLPRHEGETLDDFAKRVLTDMTSEVSRAADLGSAVHAAIEAYAQGGLLPEDKEIARLFEPARQWFDAEVTCIHSVEIATSHLEWGYAGRVDLVATLRSTGRPTVVDFKTQKTCRDKAGNFKPILHDTWPLQLEAYRMALASKDKGLANAAIASVVIGSSEPVPVVAHVWEDADKEGFFRAFLAARELWVWQKRYCPVRDARMPGMKRRRPRWSRPDRTPRLLPPDMIHPHYPHFAYNHLLLPVLRTRRVNRRRRRWPAILLGFLIGLLVGWMIRGGGALLP